MDTEKVSADIVVFSVDETLDESKVIYYEGEGLDFVFSLDRAKEVKSFLEKRIAEIENY